MPYVGAGVAGSALGMDKALFKAVLRDAGIPTTRAVVVRSAGELAEPPFPLPLFVKPVNGGSSVGVSKVKRAEDLSEAIAAALRYDDRALVEEGIDAREIECAVLGNDEPQASVPGEVIPGREFYDYDDKYREDRAQFRIPADLPLEVAEEVRRLALAVFRAGNFSGMARVDFFVERGTDRVLVNEVNTLPGFTRSRCIRSSGRRAASPCRPCSTSSSVSRSNAMRPETACRTSRPSRRCPRG